MNWKKKIIIIYNRKFDYKEAHYYKIYYIFIFFFLMTPSSLRLNGADPSFEQTIYLQ